MVLLSRSAKIIKIEMQADKQRVIYLLFIKFEWRVIYGS
jgi:hypothetical protein